MPAACMFEMQSIYTGTAELSDTLDQGLLPECGDRICGPQCHTVLPSCQPWLSFLCCWQGSTESMHWPQSLLRPLHKGPLALQLGDAAQGYAGRLSTYKSPQRPRTSASLSRQTRATLQLF